jgi:A/G-specific adenine glycosylase
LVSDAVPPPLGHALGKTIAQTLKLAAGRKQLKRKPDPSHDVYWKTCYSSAHVPPPKFLKGFFLKYAGKNHRRLPWRRATVSAFQLLIAEFLLKQTKADDVANVWPELVRRFPSAKRLGNARKADLLTILRPLGLQNQRAVSLIRLAKALLAKFDGEVPEDVQSLLTLPGVGLYTAAAVCSFKFGKHVPIVDANVLRVFGRVTGADYGSDLRRSEPAWTLAWALLPGAGCDKHNYGILDFAAQICAATPACGRCPLKRNCRFAISRGRVSK